MNQENKNSSQIPPEDFVKNIFNRPKTEKDRVSTIFTHFRRPKIASPAPKTAISSSLKPLPAAIDIGTSGIKLLILGEGKDRRAEIISIDEEPFSAGTNESTVLIKAALKRIIGRNRVGHSCVTAIPARDVHLYNMVFPPMPKDELVTAINYKVSQLKPFDSDIGKLIVKYAKWGDADGQRKAAPQKIVAACVPRQVIEQKIALFNDLGLRLSKIGISAFELVNLSRYYKGGIPKDEVTLWIDLGEANTFLAIEKGGSLCFFRNLTLTSNHLTKALAKYAGVKEEEAEELKKNYGLIFWSPDKKIPAFYEPPKSPEEAEDKSEKVYYGLISQAENLVVDIMHSFKYFSYQIAQSQITKFHRVVLCGGGANLKHLDQFLSVRLGVPVERVNTFGMFRPADDMQSRRKDLMGASTNFAVCAGLAVGQKLEESKQLNIISKEEKPTFKIFANAIKLAPVAAAVLAIAVGAYLTSTQMKQARHYKNKMNSLTKEVARTKSQLGGVQAKQLEMGKEEAEIISKKELLEARLNLIEGSLRRPEDFSGLLTSIANLMPEEVWVTRLSYKGLKLTITGSTVDTEMIAKLIEEIKKSEEFLNADFNYSEKDPDAEIYSFEIVADVKT